MVEAESELAKSQAELAEAEAGLRVAQNKQYDEDEARAKIINAIDRGEEEKEYGEDEGEPRIRANIVEAQSKVDEANAKVKTAEEKVEAILNRIEQKPAYKIEAEKAFADAEADAERLAPTEEVISTEKGLGEGVQDVPAENVGGVPGMGEVQLGEDTAERNRLAQLAEDVKEERAKRIKTRSRTSRKGGRKTKRRKARK